MGRPILPVVFHLWNRSAHSPCSPSPVKWVGPCSLWSLIGRPILPAVPHLWNGLAHSPCGPSRVECSAHFPCPAVPHLWNESAHSPCDPSPVKWVRPFSLWSFTCEMGQPILPAVPHLWNRSAHSPCSPSPVKWVSPFSLQSLTCEIGQPIVPAIPHLCNKSAHSSCDPSPVKWVRPFSLWFLTCKMGQTVLLVDTSDQLLLLLSYSAQLQHYEDLTILVHAGLMGCFHNPPNSVMDCRIFNQRMWPFCMCLHIGDLSLSSHPKDFL